MDRSSHGNTHNSKALCTCVHYVKQHDRSVSLHECSELWIAAEKPVREVLGGFSFAAGLQQGSPTGDSNNPPPTLSGAESG